MIYSSLRWENIFLIQFHIDMSKTRFAVAPMETYVRDACFKWTVSPSYATRVYFDLSNFVHLLYFYIHSSDQHCDNGLATSRCHMVKFCGRTQRRRILCFCVNFSIFFFFTKRSGTGKHKFLIVKVNVDTGILLKRSTKREKTLCACYFANARLRVGLVKTSEVNFVHRIMNIELYQLDDKVSEVFDYALSMRNK